MNCVSKNVGIEDDKIHSKDTNKITNIWDRSYLWNGSYFSILLLGGLEDGMVDNMDICFNWIYCFKSL